MRLLLLQMAHFGLVGVFNAGVDTGIFFLALATVTDSLVAANVLSWTVGVSSSYVLNSIFTFAEHSKGRLAVSAYLIFVLTQVSGFVANTLVLVIAAAYVPLLAAKVAGILAGFIVNFTFARIFVFRAR